MCIKSEPRERLTPERGEKKAICLYLMLQVAPGLSLLRHVQMFATSPQQRVLECKASWTSGSHAALHKMTLYQSQRFKKKKKKGLG